MEMIEIDFKLKNKFKVGQMVRIRNTGYEGRITRLIGLSLATIVLTNSFSIDMPLHSLEVVKDGID